MNRRLPSRSIASVILALVLAFIAPLGFAKSDQKTDAATYDRLRVFAEVLEQVKSEYVEEVSDKELMSDALNGALSSLDPHSSYVGPVDFEERQKTARREYGGLGIEVTKEDDLVKVNYVIPDGPAASAGIVAGDFITEVEGRTVRGKSLSDAVDGMRGLAGDPIEVKVLSEGQEERDVTVVRQVVQGRAVRHRVEDGLGYIYIESFNHPRLAVDTKEAVEDLIDTFNGELPALIIDLRGNPGGRVDQTVDVAGLFLDGGEVFSARGRTQDNTQRYNASEGQLLEGVPVAAIINSRSASASEILAGAIQDRGRGLVIGRRSFGKGSVQSVSELNNGGALRLTTQRYYTPSGQSIQGRGILPDVLVAFAPDTGSTREVFREDSLRNALLNPDMTDYKEDKDKIDYPPEDWPTGEDYQLSKTVELLKSPNYDTLVANRF